MRDALNDDVEAPRYVETVPRRGYRFVSPVTVLSSEAAANHQRLSPPLRSSGLEHFTSAVLSSHGHRRYWVLAASVLAMFGAAVYGFRFLPRRASPKAETSLTLPIRARRSVAVLGFRNLPGRPDDNWLSPAFAEMLTTDVAVTTGMRPSEYIGLKWQDIDWERRTVSVRRTLRKGPTGQWEYGETKRAGSRRIIRLQNWVLAKLKDLKQCQTENPVVDPEEWPEAVDLIFVTDFGRPVNVNSLVYKHFKPILKKAGLPNITLYDLRHTAATLALTVGVSPKVVSEQLGHTSAAFTLDVYSQVLPHMQDDAAAKVEAVLMGSTSRG